MKMFVWNSPYRIKYGSSIAYAIAPDVETARAAIRAGRVAKYGNTPEEPVPTELDIDREPDRVMEGPYGEIFEEEE